MENQIVFAGGNAYHGLLAQVPALLVIGFRLYFKLFVVLTCLL